MTGSFHVLSSSEVEELLEHLVARPDIWIEHQGAWIRGESERCPLCAGTGREPTVLLAPDQEKKCTKCLGAGRIMKNEFALAIKVRNGLPEGMYGLTVAPITWSQQAAVDYVLWLLEKYTAFEVRMQVLRALTSQVKPHVNLDVLSRDICERLGEVRKHERK